MLEMSGEGVSEAKARVAMDIPILAFHKETEGFLQLRSNLSVPVARGQMAQEATQAQKCVLFPFILWPCHG